MVCEAKSRSDHTISSGKIGRKQLPTEELEEEDLKDEKGQDDSSGVVCSLNWSDHKSGFPYLGEHQEKLG